MTRNAFVTCRNMYRPNSVMAALQIPVWRLSVTLGTRQPPGAKYDSHQGKMAEFRRFARLAFPPDRI
jgi:hypothetical protein